MLKRTEERWRGVGGQAVYCFSVYLGTHSHEGGPELFGSLSFLEICGCRLSFLLMERMKLKFPGTGITKYYLLYGVRSTVLWEMDMAVSWQSSGGDKPIDTTKLERR